MPATRPLNFSSVSAASLPNDTELLVLSIAERTRAYPVRAVLQREVMNDLFTGLPVVVLYCQSCQVGMAYDPRIDERALTFEPAGVRDDAEVMRDVETGSVWTQLSGSALAGEWEGRTLEMYALETMTFGDYARRFPQGEVLAE